MNKNEIIKKYVDESYKKINDATNIYRGLNNSDRKILENGYMYAVQVGSMILHEILEDKYEDQKQESKPETKPDKKGVDGTALQRAGKDVMRFITG